MGVCETMATDDPSSAQDIPASCVSAGHHHAPPVASAFTTYKPDGSFSTTVWISASGSTGRGSATTAKREPSGEIEAVPMPEGIAVRIVGLDSGAAINMMASCLFLSCSIGPYNPEPSRVNPMGEKCSGSLSSRE